LLSWGKDFAISLALRLLMQYNESNAKVKECIYVRGCSQLTVASYGCKSSTESLKAGTAGVWFAAEQQRQAFLSL